MLAGENACCRGSNLLRNGLGHAVDESYPGVKEVASDLTEAADRILEIQDREQRGGRNR